MIDIRYKTFLSLVEIGSFVGAAKALGITQPAVSQHIKYLDQYYNTKLFEYRNKKLCLTASGKILHKHIMRINVDFNKVKDLIIRSSGELSSLKFGATLTIGEYTMPHIICKIAQTYPYIHIAMLVENTQHLLEMLDDGQLDFVLLEGNFNKSKYEYKLLSKEEFIGVCTPGHKFGGCNVSISQVLKERIIVREDGSGTRDILQTFLKGNSYSLNDFTDYLEIGNMNTIKHLVSKNVGVTFLYREAANKELKENKLAEFNIANTKIIKEFNFVYLKENIDEKYCLKWYDKMKEFRSI